MKCSNIGGQAVMEGIMMKNQDRYAVAVRKTDGEIALKCDVFESIVKNKAFLRDTPFIRGIFGFIDSMRLGMGTLMYSASFFEEEEEETDKAKEDLVMTITLIVSVILALGIFMVLPYMLSSLLKRWIESYTIRTIIEGLVRIAIFVIYISLISRMEDIKRTFMYHGAEHKCINCIEHGLPLTVENVRKSSRMHKRCGTSFLFFVMLISVCLLVLIRADSALMRILIRILLIPVIAGISYEILRLAGRSENPIVNLLSKPGLAVQRLTTSEPDDQMIEVAIAAVEAVFDWKSFEKEAFAEG